MHLFMQNGDSGIHNGGPCMNIPPKFYSISLQMILYLSILHIAEQFIISYDIWLNSKTEPMLL